MLVAVLKEAQKRYKLLIVFWNSHNRALHSLKNMDTSLIFNSTTACFVLQFNYKSPAAAAVSKPKILDVPRKNKRHASNCQELPCFKKGKAQKSWKLLSFFGSKRKF